MISRSVGKIWGSFQFYYLKCPFRRKGDSVKSGTISLKKSSPRVSSPISCIQHPTHLLGFSLTWRALAAGIEELFFVSSYSSKIQVYQALSTEAASSICGHSLLGAEDKVMVVEMKIMPQRTEPLQSCECSLAHRAFLLLPGNFEGRRAPVTFQRLVGVLWVPFSLSNHYVME